LLRSPLDFYESFADLDALMEDCTDLFVATGEAAVALARARDARTYRT
jgi:hypothetical protein